MKIGIFGCSYADRDSARVPNLHSGGSKPWSQWLADKDKFDIQNYGRCASSVYFSYKNFLEYNQNFDKNIFIATTANRLYIPELEHKHWTPHFDHLQNADGYSAVKLYFEKIFNREEHECFKKLVKNDLKNYKNTLVIDINELLMPQTVREWNFFNAHLDKKVLWQTCNRYNHLSKENNMILANKIEIWIETGKFTLSEEDFVLPQLEDVSMYFFNSDNE